jgi:hypothetical protein
MNLPGNAQAVIDDFGFRWFEDEPAGPGRQIGLWPATLQTPSLGN